MYHEIFLKFKILIDSDVGGLVDGKDNGNKITETGYVE